MLLMYILTAVVHCQTECFDGCGVTALSLGLMETARACCTSGAVGYIDLSDEAAGCQLCSNLPSQGNHL